jgi:hypothetical protein
VDGYLFLFRLVKRIDNLWWSPEPICKIHD